jgi:hypothetical protein
VIKEFIGLFVDDEFLAAAIFVVVAAAAALALSAAAPPWVVGILLTVALPAVLVAGVVRTVRQARKQAKPDAEGMRAKS